MSLLTVHAVVSLCLKYFYYTVYESCSTYKCIWRASLMFLISQVIGFLVCLLLAYVHVVSPWRITCESFCCCRAHFVFVTYTGIYICTHIQLMRKILLNCMFWSTCNLYQYYKVWSYMCIHLCCISTSICLLKKLTYCTIINA